VGREVDLSVVIPVYDEEGSLPLLWSEIREVLEPTGLRYEVIFVDDGSRDRSADIVRGFREQDERVRLVRLKVNAGETAATDAGLKAALGRHVVVMDADLQNDPRDIPAMLAQLGR
jgi:glycosyltransferase involved in cell wall biosynthesis